MSGRKKGKLRAIDAGTRYDISGNLRRLARAIEQGEHGKVHHVVVGMKSWHNGQSSLAEAGDVMPTYQVHGFGNATIADMAYTTDITKKRMTGS